MATLQKIRGHVVFLFVVIGIALLAFIIGDFLTSGSSLFQQSQENIVSVNGKELNYKEYEARINELEDVYKMQSGQNNLSDEIVNQIRESVYETIVRENLLDEQAALLGVTVTSDELYDMVNGENVHYMVQQMPFFRNPQTQQFDRNIMMNVLRTIQLEDLSAYSADAQAQIEQMKQYWLFWENNLKYTRLEEKISTILSKAISANTLDAQAAFDARQRSVDFIYAFKPYSSVPDSTIRVEKSKAQKLYKAQLNQYKQTPYRSAAYVVVEVFPSQEDNDAVKFDIDKVANEFSTSSDVAGLVNTQSDQAYIDCYIANDAFAGSVKDFVETAAVGDVKGPYFENNTWIMLRKMDQVKKADSVKVRQIYVRNTAESGEHLIDSLMTVLNKKGSDFAELAGKYSEDQSASDGGEMGWFRELDVINGMGTEFTNVCFNAKKNQYYRVKSKYGLHIVQVTDMTKPVSKSKVAQLYMSVTPTSRTYGMAYNKLNSVLANNQDADSFIKAAREAGYQVQHAATVRENDYTIGNVPEMRQAVRFIFNNKQGNVSTIFENTKNQFMVVAITNQHDEEFASFESVQNQLVREVMNQEKAKSIIAGLTLGDDINAIAQDNAMRLDTIRLVNFGTRRIAGLGEEPALLSAVMGASKNEISAPLQGKNGVYVFKVISEVNPENTFNAATEKAGLDANNSYRILYQAYEAVKNEADINDSRIRFY